MQNHLKLYSGLSVYFGNDLNTKTHAHHALEIVVSVDEMLCIHGMKAIKADAVIIKPDTPHRISGNGLIISILLDPETLLCSEVISLLGSKSIIRLESSAKMTLANHFKDYASTHFTEEGICALLSRSLASGKQFRPGSLRQIDNRISKVIEAIKSSPDKSIPFTTLINIGGISGSRLMHLFKSETGTTIRRFILWNKLQHAIKLHLTGNSLKRSASLSGFTDSAHFNRVFVSNYGLNPSSMLR